jgi:transcriptional regulator with XRE-family HTH domain
MRQKLITIRTKAGLSRRQIAQSLGITERMYQHIEHGTREGKGRIWDALETIFKTPQRELRKNDTAAPHTYSPDCPPQSSEYN